MTNYFDKCWANQELLRLYLEDIGNCKYPISWDIDDEEDEDNYYYQSSLSCDACREIFRKFYDNQNLIPQVMAEPSPIVGESYIVNPKDISVIGDKSHHSIYIDMTWKETYEAFKKLEFNISQEEAEAQIKCHKSFVVNLSDLKPLTKVDISMHYNENNDV